MDTKQADANNDCYPHYDPQEPSEEGAATAWLVFMMMHRLRIGLHGLKLWHQKRWKSSKSLFSYHLRLLLINYKNELKIMAF